MRSQVSSLLASINFKSLEDFLPKEKNNSVTIPLEQNLKKALAEEEKNPNQSSMTYHLRVFNSMATWDFLMITQP